MKTKLTFSVLLVLGVTAFMSCEKEESNVAKTKIQVSDFSKWGEIHNAFLTNVKNNFDAGKSINNNVFEKIDIINDFNKKFASELDLPAKEKQLILQGLREHKSLIVTEQLTALCFGQKNIKSSNNDEENIFELIENLAESHQINDNSLSILISLSTDLKANYEGLLSDAQLKTNIKYLITKFDDIGYQPGSGEGEMLATILAISIASIEWWEENPDAFGGNLKSTNEITIAPWAAADIVGAVWGGVTGAIGSYAGSGEVNWTSVGVGALSGAVSGSTGSVGKIAKWLSNI